VPLLFSYGSLQRAEVQQAVFGRTIESACEELVGWQYVPPKVPGSPHANAVRSTASRLPGAALVVTDAEIEAADAYEQRDGYVRVTVHLASGREASMYVDARTAGS
jgi:hypothetical protein